MVTAPEEEDDDEPRYTAWLDLPISTREPMTAKDANAARKALLALDDRNMPESGFPSAPSHPRCPQRVGKARAHTRRQSSI